MNLETHASSGKKILVVSPTPSHPQNAGNRARIYTFLKNLKEQGYKIHFLNCDREYASGHVKSQADISAMMKEWDHVFFSPIFSFELPEFIKRIKLPSIRGNLWRLKQPFYPIIGKLWILKKPFYLLWWLKKPFYPIIGNLWRLRIPYYWLKSSPSRIIRFISPTLYEKIRPIYRRIMRRKSNDEKSIEATRNNITKILNVIGSKKIIYQDEVSQIDDWYNFKLDKYVRKLHKKFKYDVVLCEYVFMSRVLNNFDDDVLKIIDTHDVFANRNEKYSKKGLQETFFSTTINEEKKGLNRADKIIAIQDEEREYFKSLTNKEVITIGHTVAIQKPEPKTVTNKNILYIGTGNIANIKGINGFIQSTLPLIKSKISGVKLILAGHICKHIEDHAGVVKMGEVKDIADAYRQADIVINPGEVGTGLKIKNIEALGRGKILITSSHSAEGLNDMEKNPFIIADTPDEVTNALVNIMNNIDLYNDTALRAYEFAQNYNETHLQNLRALHIKKRGIVHSKDEFTKCYEGYSAYDIRDKDIIDYQVFQLGNVSAFHKFRGSKPSTLEKGQYITCIGAAQTYGCYAERPFPELLEKKIDYPILNMGWGGAGPEFFLHDKELIRRINDSKFVVLQVMAGRGEANSLVKSTLGARGIVCRDTGEDVLPEDFYEDLLINHNVDYVKQIVEETRETWVNNYKELMAQIKVPIVLFWISTRTPDYEEKYNSVYQLFGGFPQLINKEALDQIIPHAQDYVECVTGRGLPQKLTSRFGSEIPVINLNGKIIEQPVNNYYPSPEMHEDATNALEPACKKLLNEKGAPALLKTKAQYKANNCIIFTFPRTGSSTLRKIFDLHPGLSCVHEPFNDQLAHILNFSGYKYNPEDIDSSEKLKLVLDSIFESKNCIKHLDYQLPTDELNEQLLLYPNAKIIFLWRKNLLQRNISNYISTKAQYWHSDTNVILKKQFEPIPVVTLQKRVDQDLEKVNTWRNFIKNNVKQYFELAYEDIYDTYLSEDDKLTKLSQLFGFLGVEDLQKERSIKKVKDLLNPQKTKLNSELTYKLIPNIKKIEMQIGCKETGYVFEK